MKKITAVILFAAMVLSLAACGKEASPAEKGSDPVSIPELTEKASDTAEPTSEAETTTVKCDEDDFDHEGLAGDEGFRNLDMTMNYFGVYDCESEDAVDKAYSSFFEEMYYLRPVMLPETGELSENGKKVIKMPYIDESVDPMELIGTGYYTIDGEYADSLLKKVYNIEPDHSKKCYTTYTANAGDLLAYYYDGNYYARDVGHGFGGFTYEVEDHKKGSDGVYDLTIAIVDYPLDADPNAEDLTGDVYGRLSVRAKPVKIEGDTWWSIYKVEEKQ